MFVDVEGGAVNVKIALVARIPGIAAAAVRAIAKRTLRSSAGELVEPAPGGVRLVGFDGYVPALKLDSGEMAHPHLYAIDASARAPVTEYEWHSLFHGADAIVSLGPRGDDLAAALRLAPAVPVHDASEETVDAVVLEILGVALAEAAAMPPDSQGGDAVGFAEVTCPWCLEAGEVGIEADVEGSFVQDCEVCCRPWTVSVRRDESGELQVDVERA